MLNIGPFCIDTPVALAPMAGVTDSPFRQICRANGAGFVVSEMLTADPTLWQSRKSTQRLQLDNCPGPRAVQIVGGDAQRMAQAAQMVVDHGADIVDINFGCPAKKVCKSAAGSALLRDLAVVEEILSAVVAAVEVPVTIKTRTGWSPECRNGLTLAKMAQDCGVAAIAVHGRTRACGYSGEAEYETLASIVDAVDIPVWANGDITSPQKARQVLDSTGAAGVMIGRAAHGQPWIFGQISHYLNTGQIPPAPRIKERQAITIAHMRAIHTFYGDFLGVRIARKHVSWYLSHETEAREFMRGFNQLHCKDAQISAVHDFYEQLAKGEDIAA